MTPNLDAILSALDARKSGDQYAAKCPAHDDAHASLSIGKPNGKIVFKCHAGCAQDEILSALRERGLWPSENSSGKQIIATYDYTNADGVLIFQAVRYQPKDFRQRRPDGEGGWIWNLQGIKRVLFNLPTVTAAIKAGEMIVVVEGEKDVENLRKIGITATTNAGGAGKWRSEYSRFLKGARVVILPDNDEPGRKHAHEVAQYLANIAAQIKFVKLPGLPPKGDVSDWLAAGGTREELLRIFDEHEDVRKEAKENEFAEATTARETETSEWPASLDLEVLAEREPELPKFIISDWLPAGYATLLAGHGGIGKSLIALYLAVCIAAGVLFFGLQVARRRVKYLACEDREGVLHWRLSRICAHLGLDLASLRGWLEIIDLVGADTILWDRDPRTGNTITPAYGRLQERMGEHQTEVLIVDGISDTFAGNENARAEVKRFVNGLVALIPRDTGAVLLVGHVAKLGSTAGASGEGYSGSTGWHNSVRARWYLYPEAIQGEDGERNERTGDLILELQKSNMGRTDQSIRFAWDEDAHLFLGREIVGATQFDRLHRDRIERQGILNALKACAASVPPIIVPSAMSGPRTGHNTLSLRPEFPETMRSGRPAKRRFWRQIETLRQMHAIEECEYRRSNRHVTAQIVLTQEGLRQCAE